MTFPFLKACIYHATLFGFYVLYGLFVATIEAYYHVYVIIVENILIPVTDALWTTEFRLVRLLCRLVLAPHSLLIFYSLNNRNAEKMRALEFHKTALESAAEANADLFLMEGYSVPQLLSFVRAQLILIYSGIDVKFTDGKRLHEKYLHAMLKARYSRS